MTPSFTTSEAQVLWDAIPPHERQCQAAEQYVASLPQRFETEAQNLARLTGWDIATVREKMASNGQAFEVKPDGKLKWYQKLWKK